MVLFEAIYNHGFIYLTASEGAVKAAGCAPVQIRPRKRILVMVTTLQHCENEDDEHCMTVEHISVINHNVHTGVFCVTNYLSENV